MADGEAPDLVQACAADAVEVGPFKVRATAPTPPQHMFCTPASAAARRGRVLPGREAAFDPAKRLDAAKCFRQSDDALVAARGFVAWTFCKLDAGWPSTLILKNLIPVHPPVHIVGRGPESAGAHHGRVLVQDGAHHVPGALHLQDPQIPGLCCRRVLRCVCFGPD